MKRHLLVIIISIKICYGPDVVTDPGSYTYYVEQINQMSEMIRNATEQVRTLGGIKTVTDEMKRQIYTVQDSINGALEGFTNAADGLFNEVQNADNTVDDIFSMDRDSISTVQGDSSGIFYRSTAELIDDVFTATGTMPVAEFLHLNDERLRGSIRKDMAQYAWQRLISDQDAFSKRQKESYERTKQVFQEIQNAGDMVNVQKSTAALLQELVMIQNEMLRLQKYAIVAYAYGQYKGVDLNKLKQKVNTYNDKDDERRRQTYEQKKLLPKFDAIPTTSMDEIYNKYIGGGGQ